MKKLYIRELDTTFGLLPWGAWVPRQPQVPDGGHSISLEDGTCIAVNPVWRTCDGTEAPELESLPDSCARVDEVIVPDGALTSPTGTVVSSLFGQRASKLSARTRKIVVAIYQALMERLVVSRMVSQDPNDCHLMAHLGDSEHPSYETNPLACVTELCNLNDASDRGITGSILSKEARALNGAIRGKIADGDFARAVMRIITDFMRNPRSIQVGGSANAKVFPPTPTRNPYGHLPSFGDIFSPNYPWFSKCDIDDIFKCGPCHKVREKISALKTKIMPRLGASDSQGSHTDSWLTDMTMRKSSKAVGIDPLNRDTAAPFFRCILETATLGLETSRAALAGIVEAFTAECIRTDAGDASGDFAATEDDFCALFEFAEALERSNFCAEDYTSCLVSPKTSAVALGYVATVLGSFGQNAVVYDPWLCDDAQLMKAKILSGTRTVGYLTCVYGVVGEDKEVGEDEKANEEDKEANEEDKEANEEQLVTDMLGWNPCSEDIDVRFEVGEITKNYYCSTTLTDQIGISSQVSGYGGVYPWYGGGVILYPRPEYGDCAWCGLLGNCVVVDQLLADCKWRLFNEVGASGGEQGISFNFSWPCVDECGLPVLATATREAAYGQRFKSIYPSRTVLMSRLIEFLRDINLYYVVHDLVRYYDDDEGRFVHRRRNGFHHTCLSPQSLKDIISKSEYADPTKYYLSCSYTDLVRKIVRYVEGDTQIVSPGYDNRDYDPDPSHRRRPGDKLPGVIHPTSWPITHEMVFCGSNAFIDSRGEAELQEEIGENIVLKGDWPIKVRFSATDREIEGVLARNLYTGCYVEMPARKTVFRCRRSSYRDLTGWYVGNRMFIGVFGPVFGKWEPYNLATEHRFDVSAAFGVIRWDYQVMRRI